MVPDSAASDHQVPRQVPGGTDRLSYALVQSHFVNTSTILVCVFSCSSSMGCNDDTGLEKVEVVIQSVQRCRTSVDCLSSYCSASSVNVTNALV